MTDQSVLFCNIDQHTCHCSSCFDSVKVISHLHNLKLLITSISEVESVRVVLLDTLW